jgi:lipoprotein-anchoring transpeptidase ErfK/SrfK
MNLNVVFASLIAAVSLHSGALAQSASEPVTEKHAAATTAAPAGSASTFDATIAAPEKAKPKSKRRAAASAPARTPEPPAADRVSNFFRGGSASDPGTGRPASYSNSRSASVGGSDASQQMMQRAVSSYSTSSNALGFGLYRITPKEVVSFNEKHAPGTILVRQREKRLYYVNGDGTAIRYAIAVGREGAAWSGTSVVSDKREWPGWTPTPDILRRQPDLPRHVEGGPANPLGARALYLGQTLYRIHGTNEPWRIGEEASSGCIRMTNDDVVDLYNRTRLGATVIVTR